MSLIFVPDMQIGLPPAAFDTSSILAIGSNSIGTGSDTFARLMSVKIRHDESDNHQSIKRPNRCCGSATTTILHASLGFGTFLMSGLAHVRTFTRQSTCDYLNKQVAFICAQRAG